MGDASVQQNNSAASSDQQKTSDLARIRDNQRRSRARRKEYLEDLEKKWRNCEQTGIEASAEIQAAARRVANENKKLRQLLRQHGIRDAEVNQHLSAVGDLESMLGVKRACSGKNACGPKNISTAPFMATPAPTPAQPDGLNTMRYPSIAPSDSSSNSANTPHTTHAFLAPAPISTSPPWTNSPTITSDPAHAYYAPNASSYLPPAMHNSSPSMTYSFETPTQTPPPDLLATASPIPHHTWHPATDDSSSCHAVADAIRYVRPNVGRELEAAMGCGSGSDCRIPNAEAFDLMDRFSDVGMGMREGG